MEARAPYQKTFGVYIIFREKIASGRPPSCYYPITSNYYQRIFLIVSCKNKKFLQQIKRILK